MAEDIEGRSVCENTVSESAVERQHVPVSFASAFYDERQRHQTTKLRQLPSHLFSHCVWHDLVHSDVKGSQLKAPRVRTGAVDIEHHHHMLRDKNHHLIYHTRRGRERKDYRHSMENWENAQFVNLSYQEMGDAYQKQSFLRVLKRLIRVKELTLMHNDLVDLSSLRFPVCDHLNMNNNYLNSFKCFPKVPQIKHLSAEDNSISDLNGLSQWKSSPIESLSLLRNPVCFTLNYRQSVFQILPQLKVLDNVARMPEDGVFECEDAAKTCIIC